MSAAAAPPVRFLFSNLLLYSLRQVVADLVCGLECQQVGTIAEMKVWVLIVPTLPFLATRYELTGMAVAMVMAAVAGVVWPCHRVWTLFRRDCRGGRAAIS